MEENTLKGVIRKEIDTVTNMLLTNDDKLVVRVLKLWLQSLQTIDETCKNRNRY